MKITHAHQRILALIKAMGGRLVQEQLCERWYSASITTCRSSGQEEVIYALGITPNKALDNLHRKLKRLALIVLQGRDR